MSEIEIAWVAGLLEGEGSFVLTKESGRKRQTLTVRCSMTDLDVINRLAGVVDGGAVNQDGYRNGATRTAERYKRIYTWQMSRRTEVVELINLLYPYMGLRRQAQMRVLIDYHAANSESVKKLRKPLIHGTLNAYTHHNCRCDECRTNATEVRREARQRREEVGTSLGEDSAT